MAIRYAQIFKPQDDGSIASFWHTKGTKIIMHENNMALAMITNHKTKSGILILFQSDFIQYDAIQMLAVEMPTLPPCVAPGDRQVSPSLRSLRAGLLLSHGRGSGRDSYGRMNASPPHYFIKFFLKFGNGCSNDKETTIQ